ncbi:hypothetical protein KAFR_0D03560 [Kazachstania africana CBS 2517]|uniref:MHD domain-containing protein n=1 Tax=Kazachstania africana (strain ATCC 22294 / BCRC 22015 / CBS 2517 / CECT 1963 / NBRC 1671 / NRRL Y-8276) TaxID=1071382 RepID=H2AUF4_KAZAF|nr:hypothetical protein KAFR_0D03560 [Kazachstania africana CBS 2517]CCF58004.1 hypothetical protein KAFR_0D03560 [Kazachstania africana CBS 2517]
MYIAFYICDTKNQLVFQYLCDSIAPHFSKLLTRIHSLCPEVLDVETRGNVSKDLKIYRYFSATNNLNYYALTIVSRHHDLEPHHVLESIDTLLVEYFNKTNLTTTKIMNNYDRMTILFDLLIDGGIIDGNNFYMNKLRNQIPLKNDFSNFINDAAKSLQKGQAPSKTVDNEVVPWRSKEIKTVRNEIYVDVKETLYVTLIKSNRASHRLKLLNGYINGSVSVDSSIGGVPMLEVSFGGCDFKDIIPKFHDCVEVNEFLTNDGNIIKFIPPDGKFQLMEYSMALSSFNDNLISCNFTNGLGNSNDEFEITLNINKSNKVPKINNLQVCLNFENREGQSKVKILRNTHGRFEYGKNTWIFDSELLTGTLPVLRGCVEEETKNEEDGGIDGEGRRILSKLRPELRSVIMSFQYEGQLPSGTRVSSINIRNDSTSNPQRQQLFKGVKYVTKTSNYEIRG